MRWNNRKEIIFAVGALVCAFTILGSSAKTQSTAQPTPANDHNSRQSSAPASPPAAPQASPSEIPLHPEFFVMIDPSHGGYDQGADFGGKLLEKDITLKLARELRKQLEDRGIASRLLRDSDVDLSLDRRAEITNEQRPAIYIALHAGRPGHGVRVYAPLLADAQQAAGRFLPWESAQAPALDRSKSAAQAIAAELRKKNLTVSVLGVPMRPLNNIVTSAVAVELAPDGPDTESLDSAKRNSGVATAIAMAISQLRGQTGAADTRPPGVSDKRALSAWRNGGAHP